MSKPKGGLQKKVSSIFDGVPLESDAVRGGVRHAPDAPTPKGVVPVAPSAPIVESPVAKLAVPPAPSAWPKAPSAPSAPFTLQSELKPKSSLAAALASEAPVSAPSHSAAPSRADAPRMSSPAMERPGPKSAPRVVVKQIGATDGRNKNMIMVGGLAVVFVVALLWSSGIFSGGSSDIPALEASQQVAVTKPVKIDWQRPSLPLPSRNPMRLGHSSTSGTGSGQQSANPGESSFLNVMAVYCSQDRTAALIDGRYVQVGELCRGAKITAITKDYVEYEINGITAKEYVRSSRSNQTGSMDVKPDANTNLN